jgi:hypothetical protein
VVPTAVLLLLLGLILALLSGALQQRLRGWLRARPARVFAVPAALAAFFCAAAASQRALSLPLLGLIAAYLLLPTACVYRLGPGPAKRPAALDFAAILLLWLPLELAAGAQFVPRPAQGFLHSVAYGIAILLALALFLGFRALDGMRYRPPSPRDLGYSLIGFAVAAPILIVLGLQLGFIPPFHFPAGLSAARVTRTFFVILAATALPEEILFRSLIQNSLMQRLGATNGVLLLAGVIFGGAHFNNGPQAFPNWRYAILAAIAGVIYGKVFQKSASVFSSAALHALVNTVKHLFF